MTALPSPLAARYQIVLLGSGVHAHQASLTSAIMDRLHDFGADVLSGTAILTSRDFTFIRQTAPTVAVYLGTDGLTDKLEAEAMARSATPVLPVVPDLAGFTTSVPEVLHPINGLAIDWTRPDYTEVVNVILEGLSLLRRRRRLFLSYLRRESTPVAHQLRVAFDDAGYDAFLDTNSVPKGDDFQEVLWHRLLDSDVMVVLDTPAFMTSKWTADELAQAHAMSVGIVRVAWPGSAPAPTTHLALPIELSTSDFKTNGQLTTTATHSIVTATEAMRARCLAARHENLVAEFCNEAAAIGAKVAVQPERYVVASLQNGKRVVAIPAVGVPDPNLYYEASHRFPTADGKADAALLLYDHRGMSKRWAALLSWLDEYLPVQGLRVTDTAIRLRAIK